MSRTTIRALSVVVFLTGGAWSALAGPIAWPVRVSSNGRYFVDRDGAPVFCWNDREAAGHIDIDYFHYDYDGPKAATGLRSGAHAGQERTR